MSSLSISVTTRARRPSEIDGVHYQFLTRRQFEVMRDGGELLEWAEVHGNFYGTPREPVETALAEGRDVLFDIDWQGTQQLYETMRDDVVSVFVLPPTADELKSRLERRAEDHAGRHCAAAEECSRRNPALGGIRLCAGQPRSRQELRAAARHPDSRASQARAQAKTSRISSTSCWAICARRSRIDYCCSACFASARQPDKTFDRNVLGAIAVRRDAGRFQQRAAGSGTSVFRLCRSILRRWPKAASVTRRQHHAGRTARASARHKFDQRRGHLRRRHECRRRNVEQDFRLRPPLRQHREPAIGLAAGLRDEALRHFALEHQHQAIVPAAARARSRASR